MHLKKVTVNPLHFKIGGAANRTRRKLSNEDKELAKEQRQAANLKMKIAQQEHKNRERLIKLLMKRQEHNFKIRDKYKTISTKEADDLPSDTHSELRDSINFLLDLKDQVELPSNTLLNKTTSSNGTLKHYDNSSIDDSLVTDQNVVLDFPDEPEPLPDASITLQQPRYGCLKNGNLPTYRQFKQQLTQKNRFPIQPSYDIPNSIVTPNLVNTSNTSPLGFTPSNHIAPLLDASEVHSRPETSFLPANLPLRPLASAPIQSAPNISTNGDSSYVEEVSLPSQIENIREKQKRQRKVLRRTFKIGKCNKTRNISVLLSNKTIRRQINNKKSDLKRTPISEVRNYLIRRGMMKSGSTAPVEVLRRMYEDAALTAGEIYNHNSDILVHNFLHYKTN